MGSTRFRNHWALSSTLAGAQVPQPGAFGFPKSHRSLVSVSKCYLVLTLSLQSSPIHSGNIAAEGQLERQGIGDWEQEQKVGMGKDILRMPNARTSTLPYVHL